MKIKRISEFGLSLLLSLGSLMVISVPTAHAAAITWDGGGSDNKFSTAANWVGDVVPADADSLVFDNTGLGTNPTIDNDLLTTVDQITFQGSDTAEFTITGNSLVITGGITNTTYLSHTISAALDISGNQSVTNLGGIRLSGAITGSGNLTITNGQLYLSGNNNTYSGDISLTAGEIWAEHASALGDTTGTTTIADGAALLFVTTDMGSAPTVNEPITIAGDGVGTGYSNYALGSLKCFSSGCTEDKTLILGGNITLTADTKVAPGFVLKLTGGLSGAHSIGVAQGWAGTLTLSASSNTSSTANGNYKAPEVSSTLSDDQPTQPVSVDYNETIIITGKRGDVSVNEGGTLKGTGTVGTVVVSSGAILAPGQSPGCLNTSDLTINGTYQVEIGGTTECTGYDQTNVTGAVNVTGATLSLSLYGDFKPAAGQTYTIIKNDSTDAVTGTFTGLAEGAKITAGGYVYQISYVGGDGNDVMLSVFSVPTTPDTGFSLITSNPIVALLAGTLAAVSLLVIAKRYGRLI